MQRYLADFNVNLLFIQKKPSSLDYSIKVEQDFKIYLCRENLTLLINNLINFNLNKLKDARQDI